MKLTLLLIAALFGIKYAAETPAQDEEFRCRHDEMEKQEIELLDVEEDYNPEGNNHEGRTLQDYNGFRAVGYYGLLASTGSTYQNYVSQNLIPPIVDYFKAALKVKYPVTGLLKVNSGSLCGVSTPSILRSGVNADYMLMMNAQNDVGQNWVAECRVCYQASGSRRPLVALATVNQYKLKATNDVLLHEKNMLCIMHEITHSLGLTNTLFRSFLDSNGRTLTGHIVSASLDGATNTVLAIEPVRTRLRQHFGCDSLKGLYIENGGGSGTAGSHPERRQWGFDYMTSGLSYQMQVTDMTLSFLESTGWYIADYSYAEPFYFGKNQGCKFATGSCASGGFDYNTNGFCQGATRGCAHPGRGGGVCTTDRLTGSCKWYHPSQTTYDCDNAQAANHARLPSAEAYGRGKNAKCFTGTLATSAAGSTSTSFCFKFVCHGNQLNVEIGSKTAICTSKGPMQVPGYGGHIDCPDPAAWCSTVGTSKCVRGCMGRGQCVNGQCQCHTGYRGVDCALSSSF